MPPLCVLQTALSVPHNRHVVMVPALGDLGATSLTPLLICGAVLPHRGMAYCSRSALSSVLCAHRLLCSISRICSDWHQFSEVPVVSSMYLVLHPLEPPRGCETHWGMHGQRCAVLARRGCVPSASVPSTVWVPCDTGLHGDAIGVGSHLHLQGNDHLDSEMCAQPVRMGYWWKAAWDTSALLMG